jgi:predicted Zn-dependent protease
VAGFTHRVSPRINSSLFPAGYDPYAFLDVLTTIGSIDPDSSELTVLMNTHPSTNDRLETLARKVDGRLDSWAPGVDNANQFRRIAATR